MISEPVVTVTCDNCFSYDEEIGLTTTAHGYDERNIEEELRHLGWAIIDGKHMCPTCWSDGEEFPA